MFLQKKQLSSTNKDKTIALRTYIFWNSKYDPCLVSKKFKLRNAIVFSGFAATERNGGAPKRHKNNINSLPKNISFTNRDKTIALRTYIFWNSKYDPCLVSKKFELCNQLV